MIIHQLMLPGIYRTNREIKKCTDLIGKMLATENITDKRVLYRYLYLIGCGYKFSIEKYYKIING